MWVIINKHAAGKPFMMLLGLAEIIDGLVRLFSLGYVSTSLPMYVSGLAVKKALHNMKRARNNV